MNGCEHVKEYVYECIECKKQFCYDCIKIGMDTYYICEKCSDPTILQRILKFLYII